MASRRYRGRNSLNGNVTHSNARLSSIEKRSIPTTISAGAIDGALLAESSVTSLNLAPNSVQGENIATGAVNTGNIADAAVTSAKLAPDALAGIEVGENAVDTAQLVDDAVTTIKIRDDNVTNAKILSIAGEKITSGTVAAARIASLDAAKITSGTFNIDRIPNVNSKVTSISADIITTGDLSVDSINADTGQFGNYYIGFNPASTTYGVFTDHIEIESSDNISGISSISTMRSSAPLFIGTNAAALGIDSNQINTAGNANFYVNGTGSSGDIVLGDGGGSTAIRNGLNVANATGSGARITNLGATTAAGGTSRTAVYASNTGVLGTNSSTARVKQDISDATLNIEEILSIKPKFFRYIEAVSELGDDAPVEVGFLAEDLIEAGLEKYVFYDTEGLPQGIAYEMYVTALQTVVKDQSVKINDLTESLASALTRLDALEAKVE